jgi:hypothetical protein
MENAVRRWYAAEGANPVVQQNIGNLLSWRPNGVPPLFKGGVVASGPA